MSLIEEALRRAQEPKLKPKAAPQPAPAPEEPPSAPAHSWTPEPPEEPSAVPLPAQPDVRPAPVATLAALLCLGLMILLTVIWTARQQPAPSRIAARGPLAETPPSSGVWNLSGVVAGSGDAYAVINDLVVRTGDQIGGAVVEDIAPNAVRLRLANGTTTYLQVPR